MRRILLKSSSDKFLADVLIDLANMRDDGVKRFRKRWKHLYRSTKLYNDSNLIKRRDELRLLWEQGIRRELAVLPINMQSAVETPLMWEDGTKFPSTLENVAWLEESWLKRIDGVKPNIQIDLEAHICEHWLRLEKHLAWTVQWTDKQKSIQPKPSSLPAVLAFGCIKCADHLAYCRNPDCVAAYFIAKRRDQKYCTNECAAPAKRAAKLQWWHENLGGKKRKPKKSGKGK